jgi:peroxiredoxin
MLKRTIFIFFGMLIISSCGRIKQFDLSGDLPGIANETVYLQLREGRNFSSIDSTKAVNGVFHFKGTTPYPRLYAIWIPAHNQRHELFLENEKIKISVHPDVSDAIKVTGSQTQFIWDEYLRSQQVYSDEQSMLAAEWRKANEESNKARVAEIEAEYEASENRSKQYLTDFIKANSASWFSPYIINRLSYQFDLTELQKLFSMLDPMLGPSADYQKLEERITILERVDIGMPLLDFRQESANGDTIALSDFKGKLLLIDFWASWCRPCRIENPHVVALYKDYHHLGFEILGVSLDTSREKWLQAIADDELEWPQVSDLRGWENRASELYGVRSIPHTVLISPDGIIIEKNLRGDALRAKIAELLTS